MPDIVLAHEIQYEHYPSVIVPNIIITISYYVFGIESILFVE